jgi:hypothetical protein
MRRVLTVLVLLAPVAVAPAQAPDEPAEVADAPPEPPAPPDAPPPADGEPEARGDEADDAAVDLAALGVSLAVRVEGEALRTGDVAVLVLEATLPEGADLNVPEQALPAAFELLDTDIEEGPADVGRRLAATLRLLSLEPGEHALDPLELRLVLADGEVLEVAVAVPAIVVGSHLANEPDAELQPPRDPVALLVDDWLLFYVLLGLLQGLLALAVVFLAMRGFANRRKAAKPPPPPRPPWEIALEQLRAIEAERRTLLDEGQGAVLVDQISDTLRAYLGGRYDFNGLESTTDEVLKRLRKVRLPGPLRRDIRDLLNEADLVKFARAEPDPSSCERMLERAFQLVHATTPSSTEMSVGTREAVGPPVKDGDVLRLPVSAGTFAEADQAVPRAVLDGIRAFGEDRDLDGRLEVVLSAELGVSEETTRRLAELRERLAAQLEENRTARGAPWRLTLVHFHERPSVARKRGVDPRVTVLDDDGTREERRPPSPEPATVEPAKVGPPTAGASIPTAEGTPPPPPAPPPDAAAPPADPLSPASAPEAPPSTIPEARFSELSETGDVGDASELLRPVSTDRFVVPRLSPVPLDPDEVGSSLPGSPEPAAPDLGEGADDAPTRVLLKDGSVAVPLDVADPSTLRLEVRAAVLSAVLDLHDQPGFNGKVRVALGPALAKTPESEAALRRLEEALGKELGGKRTAAGEPVKVRLSHQGAAPRPSEMPEPGPPPAPTTLSGNAFGAAGAAGAPPPREEEP